MFSTAKDEGFVIRVGGLSRAQLVQLLLNKGVLLNSHAETLLAHPAFEAPPAQSLRIVERTVDELGFKNGAVQPRIFAAARSHGLELCPLVTGPYLRLAMMDQANAPDAILSAGRAPTGAIHVASMPLSNDVEDPKGFYLRVVDGQPWLRGYRCDDKYLWDAEQRLAFLKPAAGQ
ncbi:hypothetical protein OHC50_08195 [Paenarthrobacter ilicis]|uniref:hypothetical protein n=1 Tax=Paenarthrobacter ilicis TaxID=43665 RepID=UPI003009E637